MKNIIKENWFKVMIAILTIAAIHTWHESISETKMNDYVNCLKTNTTATNLAYICSQLDY